MPIYLPPISRRRFLHRTLTAAGALALAPKTAFGEKPLAPDSWVLLSDVHIAADRAQLGRGINMAAHLETVSKEILALEKRPAGALITGDCAFNTGEVADYNTLTSLLQPLREGGMPLQLLLGNHDNREHFWGALAEEKTAKRPLQDKQATLLRTPKLNWFLLDSLETTLSTPGLLGTEQLTWLAQSLDSNKDKPALVLVHHNPGLENGNIGLKDTVALFEVIRPRKQVKAYLFGHTHKWHVSKDNTGLHLINLPPVAYNFYEGDPSGWVHLQLEAQGARLELSCIDKTHKAHGQVVKLDWRS